MAEPDVSEQAGVREQAEDSEPRSGPGRLRRRPGGPAPHPTDRGGPGPLGGRADRPGRPQHAALLQGPPGLHAGLAAADPAALDKFLSTGSARLTRLFHDVDARADAIRRVQVIYRKARELLEERGIRAGYLAAGLARWDELFREPAAPVLLRGLTITPTRARHDDFELVLDDDYEVNPVLLYKLASVFGAATEELAEQPASTVGPLLCRAAEAAEVPGFEITDRRVIGTFTYAKLPMVRDLQAANELLNDSDVVAAVAATRRRRSRWARPTRPSAPGRTRRCWTRRRTTSRCWTPTPHSAARSAPCWPGAAWSSTGRRAPARARPSPT